MLIANELTLSRQGISLEDITPKWQKAKFELEQLEKQSESLEAITKVPKAAGTTTTAPLILVQLLKRILQKRHLFWTELRDHTAVRARTLFTVNLHNRSLEGRLEFDHGQKKLGVRVSEVLLPTMVGHS